MPTNKCAILITGGTKGLGLATAQAFAKKSTPLILTYRSDEKNALKVKKDFESDGVECHVLSVDFTDEKAPTLLFKKVAALTSRISVYVHNAAATVFKPLLDIQPHHLQKTFNITVFSFVQNVQRLMPLMTEGGAIITVSGMDTLQAVPFHGTLAAAKASLEMLTRYFAHELASRNIRVNGVNPGFIPTDSTRTYLGPYFDEVVKSTKEMSPWKQTADAKAVADTIFFLASDEAKWVVGQTLTVDGGQTFASPAFLVSPGAKKGK